MEAMAEVYHFGREYVLWKLTYPQIHRYLDAHAKKQPQPSQDTPTSSSPPRASSLKNFGFSVG